MCLFVGSVKYMLGCSWGGHRTTSGISPFFLLVGETGSVAWCYISSLVDLKHSASLLFPPPVLSSCMHRENRYTLWCPAFHGSWGFKLKPSYLHSDLANPSYAKTIQACMFWGFWVVCERAITTTLTLTYFKMFSCTYCNIGAGLNSHLWVKMKPS